MFTICISECLCVGWFFGPLCFMVVPRKYYNLLAMCLYRTEL